MSSALPNDWHFDLNESYRQLSFFETPQGERPIWMRDGASITIRAEIRFLIFIFCPHSLDITLKRAVQRTQAANLYPGHMNIVWRDHDDPQAPEIAERVSRFLLFV